MKAMFWIQFSGRQPDRYSKDKSGIIAGLKQKFVVIKIMSIE